jgi:hypothetical protein
MPSTVTCTASSHTLTSAQTADLDVLLLADSATTLLVPANAAPGTVWLVDVNNTTGQVTVAVAGGVGSVNGSSGGSATALTKGTSFAIMVRSNPGSPPAAPAVRVVGEISGRLARVIERTSGLASLTADDSGSESRFIGTVAGTLMVPPNLPDGWRHTVWNRAATTNVTITGEPGVSVNEVDEGAVTVEPKQVVTIASHGSDIVSITKQSPATATSTLPWLPSDVANLTLWLEADGAGTLRDAGGSTAGALHMVYAAKTPPVYVAQWNDASGGARHFAQATGANQPTFNASLLGSYGGLNFPGGVSTLRLDGPTRSGIWSGQAFTIATVVKVAAVSTNNTSAYEANEAIISDGWSGMHLRGPSGGPYVLFGYAYDTAYRIVDRPFALNTAYVAVLWASGGTMSLSLNGGTPASVSLPGAIGGAGTTQIGTLSNLDLGAVLAWSADIGDTHRASAVAYLANKAGITL